MRGENAKSIRVAVRKLVEKESDHRVRLWARVRLGGERGVTVARECGYADASGVTQVVKRLEARAATDRALTERLRRLRELSIVND
jgi:hypothetical protein